MEADLIHAGMRLRDFENPDDDHHRWRDLLVFLRTLDMDSNYGRLKSDPEDRFWTPDRQLMATIADRLAVLIWQPTENGRKGRNPPKPIPRPGVTQDTDTEQQQTRKRGGKKNAHTSSRMAKMLGWD